MKKKIIVAVFIIIALTAIASSISQKQTYKLNFTKPVRILFVGDMMFDRTMRSIANEKGYGYLFSCIKDYLNDFDLVVGNLEGPITDFDSLSSGTKPGESGNTTFTFSTDVAKALFEANIRVVNIGNNHILDFDLFGLDQTKEKLSKEGVLYFGVPGGEIMATTSIKGRLFSLVNFNQFVGENKPQKTIESIWRAKRSSDFVIVYAHWGDEYLPATDYEKSLAHSFIDAGADIIVGSHPHIIQETEIYNGKNIHYSLGNFVFDQYFSDEVKTGGGVELVFDGSEFFENKVLFDIRRDGTVCLKN